LQRGDARIAGSSVLSKPVRTVLRWQVLATAVLTLVAAPLTGMHGALSAALGGAVNVIAGGLSALVAARRGGGSAGGVLIAALTAEGLKIGLLVGLSWAVLASYDGVVVGAFVASFVVTALIFAMAFFVRDNN
jgi:ATP synthase protein I